MNKSWQMAAEQALGAQLTHLQSLGGGDFAEAYRSDIADGRTVFIKTHAQPPPAFFTTEAAGLEWLRASGAVNVPEVLSVSDDPPYLVLAWVEIGNALQRTTDNEAEFGRALAQLHQQPFAFGRADKCTTGSLAVPNKPCSNWTEFYATQRLQPLARIAAQRRALSTKVIDKLFTVSERLAEFGAADEPASLLHGDLWAGNRVVDSSGNSWLIDPAAHGGHREFDLAMMQLFGGFDSACYAAYAEQYPLQAGWQSRVALHQLAPLVVHAIKFGGAYRQSTEHALAQYN